MSMKFTPRSNLGKWSGYFAIAFIVLVALAPILASTLYADVVTIGDGLAFEFQKRPLLILAGFGSIICGLTTFVLGLLAIFKSKDRAVLVFFSTALGLLAIIFLVGEFFSPEV